MRPVLPADLDLAARVLLVLAPEGRAAAMDEMLGVAEAADRHRLSTGRLPEAGGDGSLIAVALSRPRSAATVAGSEYRRCLGIVLDRLDAAAGAIQDCGTGHHTYISGSAVQSEIGSRRTGDEHGCCKTIHCRS